LSEVDERQNGIGAISASSKCADSPKSTEEERLMREKRWEREMCSDASRPTPTQATACQEQAGKEGRAHLSVAIATGCWYKIAAMAIYHMSTKVLSRSSGRNVVNAAAYRRAARMRDERTGESFNYEKKQDVLHSEIAIPKDAPSWAREIHETHQVDSVRAAELLWNRVEQNEKRSDGQLAREVELALPAELNLEQNKVLVHEFVGELTSRGMVADWSIHEGKNDNIHVHILVTTRPLTEQGFGSRKVPILDSDGKQKRDSRGKLCYAYGDRWGSKEDLKVLRERWAEYQNFHLAMHGHEVRVDHRSFQDRGIELIPGSHIGVHAEGMHQRGKLGYRQRRCEKSR
jgi:hypothetical protein